MEKLYTCEEVAERYGVRVTTVWDWVREQKLPAIQIGRSYRVQESDLLTFEQQNRTTNTDTEE